MPRRVSAQLSVLDIQGQWREETTKQVAESGRQAERSCSLTLGGAVWDAFRKNANCGGPVG